MKKRIGLAILTLGTMFMLVSCGPSEEKIAEAQSKYRELVMNHNQVSKANSQIGDNSLDAELEQMVAKIDEIKEFNLNEMTDEEIDMLIDTMNTLNDSYSGYLKTIGEIKLSEDAKILTPISFSIVNGTNMTFSDMSIKESGESDLVTNVLDNTAGFEPEQRIIGLTIYKDAEETPWVLSLKKQKASEEEEDETYAITFDLDKMGASDKVTELVLKTEEDSENLVLEYK